MIRPGTLCYLVRLNESPFNGRVVEVIAAGDDCWLRIDAAWLREIYGDREVMAKPPNLRPIAGPGDVEKNHSALEARTALHPFFCMPGINS